MRPVSARAPFPFHPLSSLSLACHLVAQTGRVRLSFISGSSTTPGERILLQTTRFTPNQKIKESWEMAELGGLGCVWLSHVL